MLKISDAQWNLYLQKYEKLIWMISRRITGDEATANIDDNYADLCIAAINSIVAYNKKTGIPVDEFLDTKLFGQYTKTVLWNLKNKKGAGLTAMMPFRNKHFSISDTNGRPEGVEEDFDIEDKRASDFKGFSMLDMFKHHDDDVRTIVKTIISDPTVVNSNGKLSLNALVRLTGLSVRAVNIAVDKVENFLGRQYGTKNLEAN